MKLPLMAALAALTLWGCSSQSANTRTDDGATGGSGASGDAAREQAESRSEAEESPGEAADVVDNERRDREGAPTVHDGEATGGSGTDTTVTTPDGEKWDVQEEPNLDGEPNDTNREAGTGGSGEGNDLGGGVSGESEPDSAAEEVDGSR